MRIRRRRATQPEPPTGAAGRPDLERDVGSATHVGRRPDNQDRCFVDAGLAVVSDGMGGYRGGGRAAALSVDAVVAALDGVAPGDDAAQRVREAFASANEAVRTGRATEADLGEMGATLTVALMTGAAPDESRWLVGHVGDSPGFVVTGDSTTPVTTDHTLSAELVAAGVLTEAQAATHPGRHLLRRAIGPDPNVPVDLTEVVLRGGDALVLCSDGVSGALDADAIGAIVRAVAPAADVASTLVSSALARGATDNVTTVVVRQVPSSAA